MYPPPPTATARRACIPLDEDPAISCLDVVAASSTSLACLDAVADNRLASAAASLL
jgi:hypothetical protein